MSAMILVLRRYEIGELGGWGRSEAMPPGFTPECSLWLTLATRQVMAFGSAPSATSWLTSRRRLRVESPLRWQRGAR